MKKRLLSLVLCLVMVFSLFPAFGMNAAAVDEGKQNEMGFVQLTKTGWTADEIAAWQTTQNIPEGYDAADPSVAGTLYYYDAASDEYYPVNVGYREFYTQVGFKGSVYTEFKPENFPTPANQSGNKAYGVSSQYYVLDSAGNYCNLLYNYEHHTNLNYHEYMPYFVSSVDGTVDLYVGQGDKTITYRGSTFGISSLYKAHTSEGSYNPNGMSYNDHWGGRQNKFDGWYKIESGSTYKAGDHNQFDFNLWTKTIPSTRNFISYESAEGEQFLSAAGNEQTSNLAVYNGQLFYKAVKEETDEPLDPPAYVDATKPNAKGGLYTESDLNGMHMSKELIPQADGTYTVELKAYAKGKTVQESSGKPTDIILVLDQSGSMEYKMNSNESDVTLTAEQLYATADEHGRTAYDREVGSWNTQICPVYCFLKDNGRYNVYSLKADGSKETYHNGNATPRNTIQYLRKTRIGALKRSLWSFAQAVAEKDAGHKIAVVGFDSNSENNTEIFNAGTSTQYDTVMANTTTAFDTYAFKNPATAQGLEDLYATSVALNAKGGTYADYGMDLALRILKDRHDSGRDEGRDAVVLFFTDGEPGGVSYNDGVPTADETIQKAHIIKDTYGAKIYTIGVFSGGDGGELDGEDEAGTDYTYTVKEYMEAVSSKYPEVAVFGDVKDPNAKVDTTADYYQLLKSGDTLAELFENVSQSIGGSTVTLGIASEIRDGIDLSNFTRPTRDDVEVFTQKGTFTSATTAPNFTGSEEPQNGYFKAVSADGVVTVRDFDYSYNFIGDRKAASGTDLAANEGRQIIVRINNLLPLHSGEQIGSNVFGRDNETDLTDSSMRAGVYRNHAAVNAVIQADVPWTSIGESAVVIDYNVPVTLTSHLSDAKAPVRINGGDFTVQGKSGTYAKDGSTLTYELFSGDVNPELDDESTTQTGRINLGAYGGVDTAFFFENDGTNKAWKQVKTLPATTVYYSDALTSAVVINEDTVGDGHNDNAASNAARFESDDQGKQVYYTFTGTGIDVYSTTTNTGKYIVATLTGVTNPEYKDSVSFKNQSNGNERVNVPSIFFHELPYGTYTLRLYAPKGVDYKLDGIRVYNPAGPSADAQAIYAANERQEQNATFTNLRELMLEDGLDLDGQHAIGYFSDMTAESREITLAQRDENGDPVKDEDGKIVNAETITYAPHQRAAYEIEGPKNEIYLEAGNAIAFTITNMPANENLKFMMGISAVRGTPGKVLINGSETANPVTTVDQYFDVTPGNDNTISVMNPKNSDMLLSLTNLKISGGSQQYEMKVKPTGAVVEAVTEDAAEAEESGVLYIAVTDETVKVAEKLNAMLYAAENNLVIVEDNEQPDTPDDPTPTPSIVDWIRQIVSDFVSNLFRSISRLFGN